MITLITTAITAIIGPVLLWLIAKYYRNTAAAAQELQRQKDDAAKAAQAGAQAGGAGATMNQSIGAQKQASEDLAKQWENQK